MQVFGLKLKKEHSCECDFLNAPHIARKPYPGLEQLSKNQFHTWGGINFSKDGNADWEESLEYLATYIKKNGPYDGVYGFSQGVALITAFSSPSIWKDRFGFEKSPWKFAILACGGGSWLIPSNQVTDLDIPSLHIKGKKDSAFKDSTKLEKRWQADKRHTYTHKRGHEIDMLIVNREPKLGTVLKSFFTELQ